MYIIWTLFSSRNCHRSTVTWSPLHCTEFVLCRYRVHSDVKGAGFDRPASAAGTCYHYYFEHKNRINEEENGVCLTNQEQNFSISQSEDR